MSRNYQQSIQSASGLFFDRFVGTAAPDSVAGIRLLAFLILFINTVWEDLPSLAYLPDDLRTNTGVMMFIRWIPGFTDLASHAGVLWAIKLATCVATFCAALGFKSRLTIPVATALAIVHGGLLREYSHMFHTCIVSMQIGLVLCFVPGANTPFWTPPPTPPTRENQRVCVQAESHGWARFACWTVLALAYAMAAVSKISHGGPFWWNGTNLKSIVLRDTLNPMHFEWGLEEFLARVPTPVYAVLGLSALIIELLYVLVLFSPSARRVIPVLAVGMHVGILFCQGILFFDLILLQAMFYNWRPVIAWMADFMRAKLRDPITPWAPSRVAVNHSAWMLAWLTVWIVNLVFNCVGGSFYPACSWGMYRGRSVTATVTYKKVIAHYADGASREARIERWIGALKDTRYRDMLRKSQSQQALFFASVARAAGDAGDKVIRFDVEKYRWNWQDEPDSPEFGHLLERDEFFVSADNRDAP